MPSYYNMRYKNKVTEQCRPTEPSDCGQDGFCVENDGRTSCQYCNDVYAKALGLDTTTSLSSSDKERIYINREEIQPLRRGKSVCEEAVDISNQPLTEAGQEQCMSTCFGGEGKLPISI